MVLPHTAHVASFGFLKNMRSSAHQFSPPKAGLLERLAASALPPLGRTASCSRLRRAQFGRMGPGFDSMGEFHHANTDAMDKASEKSLELVGRTILLTVELIDAQF